ncbi:hypothetical protein B0H17DRAFT_1065686 [Mycena rosella]|uniref:Oxidoreductase AflY n=1 Tax=Mycena rosella TaxID=1033263 RepID=A0AAD7DFH0_MYCRO|nr:hypothetical protein B0H17DRAFT_1065686 [Mycena rosella]
MDSFPVQPLKPGLVNLPGATPASAALVVELLREDFRAHHCFFNDLLFHDHLSHHILSLHDLGAPIECIQAMYDMEAAMQRPLHPKGTPETTNKITEENWTGSLGEKHANMYPDYLAFFSSEIVKHGVTDVLERYLFSPEANGNGSLMLARFLGGVVHPIIQAGYGIEFGQDFVVAQGIALAAVTDPEAINLMDAPSGLPEIKSGPSTTLLALLREVQESPKLAPKPYENDGRNFAGLVKWFNADPERGATIREIYNKWTFNVEEEDFDKKIDECMWQATLLLGATSKPGRKPRMDFFLMHLLTSGLALRVVLDALRKPLHKAQLLQAYARSAAMYTLYRGRPRIDPALAMSYTDLPQPKGALSDTKTALGMAGGGSPWLAVLNSAALHHEPHVVKAIRGLFYCAQQYGRTSPGAIIGAVDGDGNETHNGAAKVDGTLFIRVAGVLTDAMGWVAHGDKERGWDFSGIGWDETWSSPDT